MIDWIWIVTFVLQRLIFSIWFFKSWYALIFKALALNSSLTATLWFCVQSMPFGFNFVLFFMKTAMSQRVCQENPYEVSKAARFVMWTFSGTIVAINNVLQGKSLSLHFFHRKSLCRHWNSRSFPVFVLHQGLKESNLIFKLRAFLWRLVYVRSPEEATLR